MRFNASLTLAALALLTSVAAVPTKRGTVEPFPLDDGFPTPSPEQIVEIQQKAHGTLSNSTGPPFISAEGLTSLRLIDFNERTESVFFEQLLYNVTNNVAGFEVPSHVDRQYLIDFLLIVRKTEELHNLNAVKALAKFNATGVEPCTRYTFPVTTLTDAVTLAATFTSNVFGVLGDVATVFAENGDTNLVRGVLQSATAEGEQNGFFRYILGRTPQELPFTTVSTRDFAFSALHSFVDPASCPNLDVFDLKLFQQISVLAQPGAQNTDVSFALAPDKYDGAKTLYVVYINQGNLPVVVPVKSTSTDGYTPVITADFPFTQHLLNGLTIAAVTDQPGPFANVRAVADAAIWAPGFIYVN